MRVKATEHEEYCKRHFDAWLSRSGFITERQWERGSEPPDFFLTVAGLRYAVEISRIINEERITASESLSRLVDDIERERLGRGAISGIYGVDPNEALPSGPRHRREFRRRIEEYLDETRDEAHPLKRDIEIGGRRVARIEKLHSSGSMLACDGLGGGGWEDEIRAEYEKILGNLIGRKKARLAPHGPAVLVLHDALCPIGPHILRRVIRSIPDAADFEAIYVIQAEAGEIVWSRPTWPIRS